MRDELELPSVAGHALIGVFLLTACPTEAKS